MSKKLEAKKLMLSKLSKDLRDTSHKSKEDVFKAKKKPAAEEPKEKVLSKAEQLLKMKYGEAGLSEEEMEDSEHEHEEDCEVCDNEGCEHCEESEEEAEEAE